MKKLLSLLLCSFFLLQAEAMHLIGGEMRYEYIGPGAAANSKQYRIRLLLLRGPGGAAFINQYIVGVFNNDNGTKVNGPAINSNWAAVQDFVNPIPVPIQISPCIQFPPTFDYTYKTYSFVITLPDNNSGYTVAFQTYSRQYANNVSNDQGANYSCVVPGLNAFPAPMTDNSPKFNLPISVVCANSDFKLDFSATDVEGDSLVYNFCNAYDGGAAAFADFQDPAPPPYNSVIYTAPFNATRPLGNLATINSSTGIISGIAPAAGKYVICVCVSYYRNGVLRGVHRKDLIVEVSGCIPTNAVPNPGYTTCDGFNIQFNHNSTGATTVFWDFGDPTTLADTSTLDNPVYVYPDTGVYQVKFIINKGGNCTDSQTIVMRVYPGFFPGFISDAPFCVGVPVNFHDTTNTRYGVVDSWSWNFGDLTTLADTSHLAQPSYIFPTAGTYNTRFIVSNSKGCVDTVFKSIVVNSSPTVSIFPRDTTYCALDSLQLTATGTGSYSWTPNSTIIGGSTATPQVFPSVPTKYFVTLTDANGCKAKDSVQLTPLNNLTNNVTAVPPNICAEDSLTLTGTSNKTSHLSWQWTPAVSLLSPASPVTRAFPSVNTTYTLTTTWGTHCIATKTIPVVVTQLAVPDAGPEVSFCRGQTPPQLNATGGSTYSWSPSTGLSAINIPNPIANPVISTWYYVTVGVNGCTKTKRDSVLVIVRDKPIMQVTNDTLICTIDTLQLFSNAGGTTVWSPNYMISNVNSNTPLVSPDVPTKYKLRFTDNFGCFNDDSVFVDVKPNVTLNAGPDTSICRTEGFALRTTGDAVSYTWLPNPFLSSTNIKNPVATPLVTSTFTVIGNIGKCQAQSSVTVKVVPYPVAKAGADTTLCTGFNTVLQASGGSSYSWSPTRFLSNPLIANPTVINPTGVTRYIVTVTDTLGCPKAIRDTVIVTVIPALHVDAGPRDTSIVDGEPLQLNGNGALTYLWTPNRWLSNATSKNPVSSPQDSITYVLQGRDSNGCLGTDTIHIRLFTLDPDMYVPTAFTPNNDGINDLARPILIGMKALNYFRIYNRFGQLVYQTTEIGKGWNGIYGGKPQDAATFVWMAEGLTYKGQLKRKKGYVVLIR
ncbi:MAG: cell surface protein [Ferruginibacter sp.]|nr:cell surface protein [Ferruginibacter sp.]